MTAYALEVARQARAARYTPAQVRAIATTLMLDGDLTLREQPSWEAVALTGQS